MKTTALPGNSGTEQGFTVRYERIMLIDDNIMDNFINKRLIESSGFGVNITECTSAVDALKILQTGNQLPNVIFLDINMPEMNGFEFLDAFGKLPLTTHQCCKIIMLSTSESFKDLNRANKNRFVKKFLNKPLTLEVLSAVKI